ncbi:TolB family protein [Brevibacillus fluminis]|uniref:TolB family protein n=1 Tax=Brevibacillus fluminis TaxID=511487 RepID=UPI003F8CEC27
MKGRRMQGALAALVLATSLWSATTPAHAESIGSEESITSSALSVSKKGMDLSEKYAVWVSTNEDSEQSIVLYSIDNEKADRIAESSSSKSSPVTAGNYVAWIDYGRKDGDIYLYDITSQKTTKVTDSTFKATDQEIQISENYLVWTNAKDKNIYAYDLKKGSTIQLTTKGKASHPSVSNDYAVWQDNTTSDADIFYYDFKKGKAVLAVDSSDNQTYPDINDDVIVYEDDRNSMGEIYSYTITDGEETRVTKSKSSSNDTNKEAPQVYGNKVIYLNDEELRIQSATSSSSSYDTIGDSVSRRLTARISSKYVLYAVEGSSSTSLYLYNIKDDESSGLGGQAGDPGAPAASDRYVIYLNQGKKQDQVVLYDVKNKVSSTLTASSEQPRKPLVSNQYAVWYDLKKDVLVSYNVKTGKKTNITTSDDVPHEDFYALNGQYLVWADETRKGYSIMLTDLKTNKTTDVESASSDLRGLDMYDNRIIWADGKDDRIEVDVYDIDEERTTTLKNRIADIDGVSVGENYAVWSEYVGKDWELYYYDFARETVNQLNRNKEPNDQRKPKMSGNVFVYEDNQYSRDSDVYYYYLYDLDSKSKLKYYPGEEGTPSEMAIGGNRVVWIDNRDDIAEVYMMAFDQPSDDPNDGGGDGEYKDYNFKKVLEEGTLDQIIKDNGNSYDGIYFVFMDGSTEEASVSMDDASADFDTFIELIEGYGFENIYVRVYQ